MNHESDRRTGSRHAAGRTGTSSVDQTVPSTATPGGTRRPSRWRTTVPRLSQFAVEHLLLLPLGALIALVWVNTAPESYFRITNAISFAVNDVAMAFFFALMTKEVVEATAPGGVLHRWRRVLLPVLSSIGGAVVPALIYVQVVYALDEPMLAIGWPVALATDLAMCYFVARIIFRKHPMIPFVILLGITSDTLGFLALALFNPVQSVHLARGALFLTIAVAVAVALRRARVKSFWPYLLLSGIVSWFGFYWSGVHPALALIPIIPFLPHGPRDPGFFVDAPPDAKDALNQFEVWWRYPAHAALFFFGLVNAGVPLGALENGTWGLPIAVIAGRPLGVLLGSGLAVLGGLHLAHRVTWRDLVVAGFITAIGFTVALFFGTALFPPGQLLSEMRMGAILSLAAALFALAAAKLLGVGRFADHSASVRS
jgi:NhaA family Na+:H+ antiporter